MARRIFLSVLVPAAFACGEARPTPSIGQPMAGREAQAAADGTSPVVIPSGGASPTVIPGSGPLPPAVSMERRRITGAAATALVDKFLRPSIDFDVAILDKSKVASGPKSDGNNLTLTNIPWPPKARALLLAELAKLPALDLLENSLQGVYVARMSGDTHGFPANNIAGMMYHNIQNEKFVVVLNFDVVLGDPRRHDGSAQELEIINDTTDLQNANLLLATTVHELMHVADYSYYLADSALPASKRARDEIYKLSWVDDSTHKFGSDKPNLRLTSDRKKPKWQGCRNTGGLRTGLSLTDETQTMGYRRFLEKTNFFDDYSMAHPNEDFAETLSIYYMITRYDQPERLRFFDRVPTNDATPPSYVFDQKVLYQRSAKHREKACLMAKEVFNEACQ